MTLSVRNDPKRPSGGYAVLEGPGLAGVADLIVENTYSGLFLAPDGRWAKQPQALPVAAADDGPASLSLGPSIVDAIPTELQLALRSGDGRDLGRLFWADIVPSRSRREPASTVTVADPVTSPPRVEALPDEPVSPPTATVAPPEADPTIVPGGSKSGRPRALLIGVALVVLCLAGGAIAFALMPKPTPPVRVADRCVDVGRRVAASADPSDDDRVRLAEDALASGCGALAFKALDGADWETSEGAAWHLARFYDPNESNGVYHQAANPHPDWAASYYARWAARSPRQAAALKTLCASNGATLDDNAQLKRACAR